MPRMLRTAFIIATLALSPLFAGTAEEDWAAITAFDAGPGLVPKNEQEAKRIAIAHNELQEKRLRAFIGENPKSANFFEARLRLARALNMRSRILGEAEPSEVGRILEELDLIAKGPQRAELDFARLSRQMRTLQGRRPNAGQRDEMLEAVRKFRSTYPADRRIAGLLAEVAVLFEFDPKTKSELVSDAEKLATQPELRAQLADDRKRLSLLDKPVGLRFQSIDGANFDIKEHRGKVTVVLFFATWSEPSLQAYADLAESIGSDPAVKWVGISLDHEKARLQAFLRTQKTRIATGWDGKVWESPFVQTLGINSLPAVWVFDKQGILRSLDGLEKTETQISRLSNE
jgi:hypothetical protein